MGNWKTCTIGDLGAVVGGATPSTKKAENYDGGTISWITPKDLAGFTGRFISCGERNITKQGLKSCSTQLMPAHTVLFSSRAPIGYIAIAEQEVCTNQGFKSVVPNEGTDYMFLYYLLKYNKEKIENLGSGTTFKEISGSTMRGIEVSVPETIEEQRQIASVLSALDDKIEKNTAINKNLLQQAQALYREMFISKTSTQRRICRAEEYFEIAIGKTPPRKEHQWFTTNPSDVTWVSISDMGSCGTFISRSSEQLTREAVDKFNIKVIPSNTVLLSFKLTVGRIAITHGEMTTNEAIAHFKTDKPFINEYLYCYLRDFNYQTMGSTSSIATAVNSKIIKAMPFVVPADDEISRFHSVAGPMFERILNNQLENDSLAEIRDTLLPRLMSGDLDVSNLDL